MQTLEYSNKFRETNSTPEVATIDIGIGLQWEMQSETLEETSTRGHDEPRSEDRDPLKNPEQRTRNNSDHTPNHDPEESAR